MGWEGSKILLINRNFTLLWVGQLISQLGDKAYNIALLWWVLEKTGSSLHVGLLVVAAILPELLFSPIAGVWVDRWPKKTVLVATDLVRGGALLVLALLYYTDCLALWHIYAITMIIALSSALFNPATMTVIPAIVVKEQLQQANALSQMISGSVSILGPLLGASAVALLGYAGVFLLNGLSYWVSGAAETLLWMGPGEPAARQQLWVEIREGFSYILASRPIGMILIVIAAVHAFVGCLAVGLPMLAGLLGENGLRNLGVLQAAIGGGMIVGAAAVHQGDRNLPPNLMLGFALALAGAGGIVLGGLLAHNMFGLVLYAAACFTVGWCIATASITWRTSLQLLVPAQLSGRVFSACSVAGDISLPLAAALSGFIFGSLALWPVFFAAGLSIVLLGVMVVAKRPVPAEVGALNRKTGNLQKE